MMIMQKINLGILDSLELAFHEGKGMCNIIDIKKINLH